MPVAGADRMLLTDQLAVQDLVALADVLLMPEDDLALAVVLKSPLFGFDDDALFDAGASAAHGSLWAALKAKARRTMPLRRSRGHGCRPGCHAPISLPPYEFFSELLGADGQTPAPSAC